MSGKHTETEVKLRVDDLAAVQARILAAGGSIEKARIYEKNTRYEDAANSLTAAQRVLRLRTDTRVRLTYKEPFREGDNNQGMTRTELEVEVNDFETMDLLLGKLGFHPAWIYEKYRTTCALLECEIVLDEMPFGNFVEVEGAPDAIEQVIQRLELGAAPRIIASYSDLFFALKARLSLNFQDLTFENFRDITVSWA